MTSPRSRDGVPYTNPPHTPCTPFTLFSNNVRRRMSSPGPSRFLQPRLADLGGEVGARLDLASTHLPRGRGRRQGEGPADGQKTISRKHIVLWCPRLRKTDGALSIEGHLMDENIAISEQTVYSTRVVNAKGSHIRVHGRSGTEYILEGKLVAKETSFPAIFHSINSTPVVLLNKFERGFPDNWVQLRDNWNTYARKQEEVPAIITELEQAFNTTPAEGPVDMSTPYTETASGARGRVRENRRESGLQGTQLAAIFEGMENVESSKVVSRKRTERNSRGLRASSKRRRSPSVPTRKSPRLEKQVLGDGGSGKEGHQMRLQGLPRGEIGCKPKEVTAWVKVNGQQSSLQCTKCQFKTHSKWHFGRHMGSKNHKDKVALGVAAPAEVDSGNQSKVVDEAGKIVDSLQHSSTTAKSSRGKTLSQEKSESVPTSHSSTGATVSQEDTALGAVATVSRLNTSRATAREARTRCASMLKE